MEARLSEQEGKEDPSHFTFLAFNTHAAFFD
jgi:hypothetical protein